MDKILGLLNIIVKKIFGFIFKIFGREYTESTHEAIFQFVKFGIVGVTNTVVSYVLYVATLVGLQKANAFPKVDYLIATVVSFVLSVLWSFYWNNKMVFVVEEGQSRNIWKTLIKTYISYSFTGLFLNSVLAFFWVDIIGLSKLISPIINLLVSLPINFIINKFWAFKTK